MNCPICQSPESQVLDSRDGPESIRRRRECQTCKYRFTTYERLEPPTISVMKKNGDKERFEQDKIRRGVRTSCKNRPVTSTQIDDLVREVTQDVFRQNRDTISSQEIGHIVQAKLEKLDPVAYVRFTSVYQSFHDLKEFEKAIHNIH